MKQHREGAMPERTALNREVAAFYGVPLVVERTEDEHRRCQSMTRPSRYHPQRQCLAKALPGSVFCFCHRDEPGHVVTCDPAFDVGTP